MDPNLRNLRDFLTLYNKVTELCFSRCVDNLSERDLTNNENLCVDNCVTKFARFNQKMMSVYVEVQTDINQRRVVELEENQKIIQNAAATAAGETVINEKAAVIPKTKQATITTASWGS